MGIQDDDSEAACERASVSARRVLALLMPDFRSPSCCRASPPTRAHRTPVDVTPAPVPTPPPIDTTPAPIGGKTHRIASGEDGGTTANFSYE